MTRQSLRANLASWEADSASYQQQPSAQLGRWDHLGCGAAQFGIKVWKVRKELV